MPEVLFGPGQTLPGNRVGTQVNSEQMPSKGLKGQDLGSCHLAPSQALLSEKCQFWSLVAACDAKRCQDEKTVRNPLRDRWLNVAHFSKRRSRRVSSGEFFCASPKLGDLKKKNTTKKPPPAVRKNVYLEINELLFSLLLSPSNI